MTQTFCHLRGTECPCRPDECRAAPVNTIHIRKANYLDVETTKALQITGWAGIAVAVALFAFAAVPHGADAVHRQNLALQEQNHG
ncbi:hypothetical protein LAV84_18520 [Rhizobium sp. VS19-DR104.2]|uniref:hypothetical protein n=1 Tax=unclassified Rhizobium TaxID=2613769 RepID=UPI001CC71590|nr:MULTISPECIES: hypothetical protein [unclassified Rhizobium]MBZ5761538.1 hypothetical protein [Rhizobium sp. VS19-DR96]MBZ5767486.1 hypothetical protein [Rhizobium sp. VS19-DR129.2]MBZ5775065.1 hypothetical protein [Rhizobium sp. VS19-DRK62.2]MBZ5785970.1 hypothetical protein [Rhizobium sp. VS19-DR121]MBZ5803396.1 hypothetical protein [Rhizobium sp. VS19-DR181]